MQSAIKLASIASIAITTVQAELKPGACPARESNKGMTFDPYSMAGLWYEYVWDASFAQPYGYSCSTWIVLSDEADAGPGQYQVFNNMVWPSEKEGSDVKDETNSSFIRFNFVWDAPTEAGQKAMGTFRR